MLNFYPGPSKIYSKVKEYTADAFESGILEQNHRSKPFMDLLRETLEVVKEKLAIPDDYEVFFTSSATECWEILAQSVLHGNVQFAYCGAFGKKWFKYAVTNPSPNLSKSIDELKGIRGSRFFVDQQLKEIEISANYDCFCAVQNETSNGTYIDNDQLNRLPKHMLKCFDVTSSLGGQNIDYSTGDVFLSSVQKCLGLPSGMGILICSPKAIAAAEKLNERNHYNSFVFIRENFKKYQTHYTPNILNIYLLLRVLKSLDSIEIIAENIKKRATDFYQFLEQCHDIEALVKNPETRSPTVLAINGEEKLIAKLKNKAADNGIILGNGYGEWKNNSFRVANFPAIPDQDFETLKQFISKTLNG